MKYKYSATVTGLIFSTISFLSTHTFVIPFITIVPIGATLESVFRSAYPYDEYEKIGNSVVIALLILLIMISVYFYIYSFKKIKNNKSVTSTSFILFLMLQQFLIHPFVFYLKMSNNWDRAGDGQFMFGIIDTFPSSSVSFVMFGLVLDFLKFFASPKLQEE